MFKYIITLIMSFLFMSNHAMALDPIYKPLFSKKAVSGYDSVAYFTEGKAIKGSDKFKLTLDGADWYFASQENLDKFKAEPHKYQPQYGGYCAWAVAQGWDASADPLLWDIVDGKLYLNYDKEKQALWAKDKPGMIAKGDKNWPEVLKK